MRKTKTIFVVLMFLSFFSCIFLTASKVKITVKGKGDAFIETRGERTTYGCNNKNDNECTQVVELDI